MASDKVIPPVRPSFPDNPILQRRPQQDKNKDEGNEENKHPKQPPVAPSPNDSDSSSPGVDRYV
ncbi:MAG: hypothetical protein R8K22_09040 [Mariprofundaceae bacterium]